MTTEEVGEALVPWFAARLGLDEARVVELRRHAEGFSWETYTLAVEGGGTRRGYAVRVEPRDGLLAPYDIRGQYALHVLLAVLHPHPSFDAAPSGLTMFALHAAATLVVTVLLRHADHALAAAGSALRRVLPRRPFVPPADGPLRPLRVASAARVARQLALAAVPTRRGPPVGC